MTTNYKIKAADPDNEPELFDIIGLFRSLYGGSFPAQGVYNVEFWRSHVSRRFISLVALRGTEVVAHLAIQPDINNSRVVQLFLPAFAEKDEEEVFEIASLFRVVVDKLKLRQRWHASYAQIPMGLTFFQSISSEVFGLQPTALYPDFFSKQVGALPNEKRFNGAAASNGTRGDMLLSLSTDFSSNSSEPGAILYVPPRHTEICKSLYAPLALSRGFTPETTYRTAHHNYGRIELKPLEERCYQESQIRVFFARPSQFSSFSEAEPCLKEDSPHSFVHISMRDPLCPLFCDWLESYGFLFTGVSPLINNDDNIVYSKNLPSIGEESLYHERARVLCSHIRRGTPEHNSTPQQVSAYR